MSDSSPHPLEDGPGGPVAAASSTSTIPRPSVAAIARDGVAVALVLGSLVGRWDLGSDGSDHWYVVLATLLAALAPAVTHVARPGIVPPAWDVGYNRLVRYALVTPWVLCFVVLVVVDLVQGAQVDYTFYGDPAGTGGGIGAGATIGLVGVLLAIQPRLHERRTTAATTEDRAWAVVAQVLGATTLVAFALTSLIHLTWDAGLLTAIFLVTYALTFALLAFPAVGLMRLDPPWILVAVAMAGLFALVAPILSGDGLGGGAVMTVSGESSRFAGYGFVYFAASATAITAPRGAGVVPPVLVAENFRPAAARLLTLLCVVTAVAASALLAALDVAGGSASYVIALFVRIVMIVALGAGAAQLWRPGGNGAALVAAAVYVVGTWISLAVSSDGTFVTPGFADYLIPFLCGAGICVLAVGPGPLRALVGERLRGLAVDTPVAAPTTSTTDAAPVDAAPVDVVPATSTPLDHPQPILTHVTPGGSTQSWGDLVPMQGSETPAPDLPPAPPPAPPAPAAAHDPVLASAADPDTPLEQLAAIAADHPHARPALAANPSTYPDLLAWLGALGDPEIDAALRARTRR